jgi:hypothetical protein
VFVLEALLFDETIYLRLNEYSNYMVQYLYAIVVSDQLIIISVEGFVDENFEWNFMQL